VTPFFVKISVTYSHPPRHHSRLLLGLLFSEEGRVVHVSIWVHIGAHFASRSQSRQDSTQFIAFHGKTRVDSAQSKHLSESGQFCEGELGVHVSVCLGVWMSLQAPILLCCLPRLPVQTFLRHPNCKHNQSVQSRSGASYSR